ncbi:MAG: protein kinase [Deltaproteobacteria bacterium]|nr:protein kinase [Deltaproteobacteria bacterium]
MTVKDGTLGENGRPASYDESGSVGAVYNQGMSLCQRCGTRLDPDARFCAGCGLARSGTPAPGDPMIGRQIIGQYVVRQKLGEGGMGAVYLADQPAVGRQAVIKVMHREYSHDPQVVSRFEVEARAASQLNHPHIVTIYNYGAMEDGTLFLAMEYCTGSTLEAAVRAAPMSSPRAARIGAQVCDALADAHRRGIVHRDLKPSNAMLLEVGRQRDYVKVLDFGIAKMEGVSMTRTGSMVGTPQYMSPEQLRGEEIDGRSDLYSLGIMLYEMVTGQLPFQATSLAGLMHKHLSEEPQPPTRVAPHRDVTPALEAVILRALAKVPGARFRDADEMGQALESCAQGLTPVLPLSTERTQAPAAERSTSPAALWVAVGGGAVVLAAGAFFLVTVLRSGAREGEGSSRGANAIAAVKPADPTTKALPGSSGAPVQLPPATPSATPPADAAPRVVAHAPDGGTRVVAQAADGGTRVVATLAPTKGPRRRRRPVAVPPAAAGAQPGSAPGSAARPETGAASPPSDLAGLSADQRRWAQKSVAQLEAQLKRLLATARIPPSTAQQTLTAYERSMAVVSAGEREVRAKQYLVQLITAYERPALQFKSYERRSVEKLRQIFLSMPTKQDLSAEQRAQIVDNVLKTYDQGNFPPEDRPFYKRVALLSIIQSYAVDPAAVLR